MINLVRPLLNNINDWDLVISKAVHIYNNTYHSQLQKSPSQYLLQKSHNLNPKLPVGEGTSECWKEGHPKFRSFKIGQEVIKGINRMGRLTSHKLLPKYDGPYKITKVQSNGVTYEMAKEGSNSMKIYKAHHTQLRPFFTLPYAIQRYIPNETIFQDETDDSDLDYPTEKCIFLSSSEGRHSDADESVRDEQELANRGKKAQRRKARKNTTERTEKPLGDLACSEKTPEGGHSTPIDVAPPMRLDEFSVIWEQSLAVQEELNEETERELSSLQELSNDHNGAFGNEQSKDFSGFENKSLDVCQKKIERIKEIIRVSRANIAESRNKGATLRSLTPSTSEEYEMPRTSNTRLTSIMEEMRDITPEMRTPHRPVRGSQRRGLRSQGSVPEVRWVQQEVLERKKRQLKYKE